MSSISGITLFSFVVVYMNLPFHLYFIFREFYIFFSLRKEQAQLKVTKKADLNCRELGFKLMFYLYFDRTMSIRGKKHNIFAPERIKQLNRSP